MQKFLIPLLLGASALVLTGCLTDKPAATSQPVAKPVAAKPAAKRTTRTRVQRTAPQQQPPIQEGGSGGESGGSGGESGGGGWG